MSSLISVSFLPSKFHPRTSRFLVKNSYRLHQSYAADKQSLPELSLPPKVATCLDNIKWDDKGWAVAIAQNVDTGAILMQGFVNRDAVAMTISSRKATFYSRSRSTLWIKGETSNNFINVHDIFFDCDRDSIIYLGKPDGPTCHTGSETCYCTSVVDFQKQQIEVHKVALTTLYSLESTISQRKAELAMSQSEKPSWTKRLLLDSNLLCKKLREEADELCRTLEENEDKSRTASEMADVLYHAMVLLAVKDVKMEDVLGVLRKRFSQSGIEEKKSRASKGENVCKLLCLLKNVKFWVDIYTLPSKLHWSLLMGCLSEQDGNQTYRPFFLTAWSLY